MQTASQLRQRSAQRAPGHTASRATSQALRRARGWQSRWWAQAALPASPCSPLTNCLTPLWLPRPPSPPSPSKHTHTPHTTHRHASICARCPPTHQPAAGTHSRLLPGLSAVKTTARATLRMVSTSTSTPTCSGGWLEGGGRGSTTSGWGTRHAHKSPEGSQPRGRHRAGGGPARWRRAGGAQARWRPASRTAFSTIGCEEGPAAAATAHTTPPSIQRMAAATVNPHHFTHAPVHTLPLPHGPLRPHLLVFVPRVAQPDSGLTVLNGRHRQVALQADRWNRR